jgi:hypothetical protein
LKFAEAAASEAGTASDLQEAGGMTKKRAFWIFVAALSFGMIGTCSP